MSGAQRFPESEAPSPPLPAAEDVVQAMRDAMEAGDGFEAAMRVLLEVFSARVVGLHVDDLAANRAEFLALVGAHETGPLAGIRCAMGICLGHDGAQRFVVLSLNRSWNAGPMTVEELLLVKALRPHLVALYESDAGLRPDAALHAGAPGACPDLAAARSPSERLQ